MQTTNLVVEYKYQINQIRSVLDMKAMVKGIRNNGEAFDYVLEDIINVVYSNEKIVLVYNDGASTSYSNKNITISIM